MNRVFIWIYFIVFILFQIHYSNSLDYALNNFTSEQWDDIASIEKTDVNDNIEITVYILNIPRNKVQNNKTFNDYRDMYQGAKDTEATTKFPKIAAKDYVLLRKMLQMTEKEPRAENKQVEKGTEEGESRRLIDNMPKPTLTPEEEEEKKRRQKEIEERPTPYPTKSLNVTQEEITTTQTKSQTEKETTAKLVTWAGTKRDENKAQPYPTKSPKEEKESQLLLEKIARRPTPYPTLKTYQVKYSPSKPKQATTATSATTKKKKKFKIRKLRLHVDNLIFPTMSPEEYKEKQAEKEIKSQRVKLINREKEILDHGTNKTNGNNKKKDKKEQEKQKKEAEEMKKKEEAEKEHEKNIREMHQRHHNKLMKIETFLKDNYAASKFVNYEIKRIQKTKVIYDEYRKMIAQLEMGAYQKPRMAVLECFKRFFSQIKYPKDVWKYYVNRITIWDPWIEDSDAFPFKKLPKPIPW